MIRGLVLIASTLLAGAVPALAQTPAHPHPVSHPHGQARHTPADSARHAAMHALLNGVWRGTLSHQGVFSGLDLSVAQDSVGKLTFKLNADLAVHAGVASNFMVADDTLHWTQELSGAPCKATARLSAATPQAPETLTGKMACEFGEVSFSLHKKMK